MKFNEATKYTLEKGKVMAAGEAFMAVIWLGVLSRWT